MVEVSCGGVRGAGGTPKFQERSQAAPRGHVPDGGARHGDAFHRGVRRVRLVVLQENEDRQQTAGLVEQVTRLPGDQGFGEALVGDQLGLEFRAFNLTRTQRA